VEISFPEKMQCLFTPKRYKVFYGGRGAAKSWGIARALILKAAQSKIRVLCTREFQNSTKDSVHKLLSDQIESMGLAGQFKVLLTTIVNTTTGSEFLFEGIKHNVNTIRSFEGIDIAWVEEAALVSDNSWDVLIPTIRKEGSEIWMSFNPDEEDDPTYVRFVLNQDPLYRDQAIVQKLSWRDNPWFPEVLRVEKDILKAKNYDLYLHVWEGECKRTLDGVVYAAELRAAQEEGRITRVPYDPTRGVDTFWDLGWNDATAIWFTQSIGFETRVIDYMEASQKKLNYFFEEMEKKRYIYGTHHLPHDAQTQQFAAGGKTIEQQFRAHGKKVKIVPKTKIFVGINAVRTLFETLVFDESRCALGLKALRKYKYEANPDTGAFGKEPLHDQYSHAADALRYMALASKPQSETAKRGVKPNFVRALANKTSFGWMGR
jgi:phage terminase large subunit